MLRLGIGWVIAAAAVVPGLSACTFDEVGPSVECHDCATVLEPGAEVEIELHWLDEPCDNESKTLGSLVTFCTEVDTEVEIECDGPCEVREGISSSRRVVAPSEVGALTVTARQTRLDDGSVHEEQLRFDVAHADRLVLECERSGEGQPCTETSPGGRTEPMHDLTLRAYRGEEPVALDLEGLTSTDGVAAWSLQEPGTYSSWVYAGDDAISVTSADGVSASLELR